MNCDRVQPNLLDYSRRILNPREAEGIRAHLEGCAECRAVLESELQLADKLAGLPGHKPQSDVWTLVQSKIRADKTPARTSIFSRVTSTVYRKVALATVSLGVALITLAAVNPWQSPAPRPMYAKETSISQAAALMQVQPVTDDSATDTTDDMMKVLENEL